ncbi:MAG: penicillin-binding protein activator LpoB [Gammaproteobacteria bacterium]|nr:penicillin-binding protein activator LpoB [Gammaproteobacteria bacterium]
MHAIRLVTIGVIALSSVLMLGCGGTKVERMDVDKVKDLSGDWNDTDSRLVSEEMIKDVLSAPWLARYKSEGKKTPSLIVGEIKNLSHEHIAVNVFVGDIERNLINAGDVQFVASKTERQEIREERKDQDLNAAEETRKAMGKEQGADFMLKGEINTIIDAESKTQVKFYQVDLTLISLADNRKVWVGQKKIKKLVEKGKMRL